MKILYAFLLIFAMQTFLKAQTIQPMEIIAVESDNSTKSFTCGNSSSSFINKYNDFYNQDLSIWIPHNDQVIKYIKVNYVIVQKDDGTGNFSSNGVSAIDPSYTDVQFLNEAINRLNYLFGHLSDPSDNGGQAICGTCNNVKDTRIRFKLTGINYYQSSVNYGSSALNSWLKDDEINLVITGYDASVSWANLPSLTNHSIVHYSYINRLYQDYITYGPNIALMNLNHMFWHEISHNLGLCHTYYGGGCPTTSEGMYNSGYYFDDIFGAYPSTNCPERNFSWNSNPWAAPDDYISNNIMSGTVTEEYFTTKQIAAIHRKLSLYSVRKCVEMDTYDANHPLIVNNDEDWDFDFKTYFDIIIKSGSTLTLKCHVRMPAESKIIVEPGAKLILDGGTITNHGGGLWQGIEVWGNSNQQQESSFWDPNQGIVKIINGTIENADNAITLWHPGDWYSMGGIVDANGATFLNNHRSVEFMKYQNKAPNGNTYRNESSFTNCTFKVDDNYRGGSSNPFSSHVTLWDVNGVFFTACTFLNEQSTFLYSLYNNKAIYSMDAGYTVRGTCDATLGYGQPCPSDALVKSTFKGFNTAVHALGGSTSNVVKVEDAVFDGNFKGVQYDALNNSWVNKSDFFVGHPLTSGYAMTQEGIIINSSTGYRIEENVLQPNPNITNFAPSSIRVRNSNTSNNQIYKNTTTGLYFGEQAEGINRNSTNSFEGLQILCNKNSGTERAISVMPITTGLGDGIRVFQGNPYTLTSAGNIFLNNSSDIVNNTTSTILYYHTGGQTEPLNYTPTIVIPLLVNNANTCPSYGNFSSLPADTKAQLRSEYSGKEATYINLLYNYNSLINGGNTNLLLNKIEMSWPKDAWELRAELLSKSPYLKEDVLREMAKKGILPQAMVLEICLANPDGTRNKEFIDFLGEKIPNPLPQYMLDLIVANWDAKTVLTLLEGSLADVSSKMAVISNLLISNCMLDSIINKDEARSWLLRRGNISDYYSVAESYIESNNFDNALNYANQIPDLFKLSKEQQAEHLNFKNYVEFRGSIAESGKNIMQLKDNDIETLQQIANNNTGRSSVLAQNILCFGYQLCVDYLPADGKGGQLKFTKPQKTAKEVINAAYNKITATPNPADVYVAFTWELPLLESDAILIITDVNGKSIEQKTINTKNGQWIWDTRTIKKGIYFYEIKTDNERLGNGKIVINN